MTFGLWKDEAEAKSVYDAINKETSAKSFIQESLSIEGIHRRPTVEEIKEYYRFMELEQVTIEDLEQFVSVYEPKAKLRDKAGMNVRVGDFYPIAGGPAVRSLLLGIVHDANMLKSAYKIHQRFEALHPFQDCNGRSGRMLWIWMMREAPYGFLRTWYYQSLSEGR